MKKNKIRNIIVTNIILILLSLLASFLIYNFELFFISSEDRVEKEIELTDIKYEGFDYVNDKLISNDSDKKLLKINYSGYINKLVINYNCEENFDITVNYRGYNYFNEKIDKEKSDSFNVRINTSVIKIGEQANKLNINFNKGTSFTISSIKIDNTISFNWFVFIYIILGMMSLLTIFSYYKKKLFDKQIEYLFLSISILIGSLFILLQPYTTSISWDDQIHYSTIYRIFELDGSTEWTKAAHDMTEVIPFVSVNTKEERSLENKYLNNATEIVKVEANSPLIQYNQIGYLVPGAVSKICSILHIPFIINIILAKLSILVTYSMLMFFAIKIIPRGKRIMSVIGLLPSVMFLATQFSYDTPIIGGIALFIALFIKILEDKSQVDFKTCVWLLLSIIIACFIKAIYIPIILLALFIPKDRFKTKKQHIFFKVGIVIIFILLLSTFVLPTLTETSSLGDLRGGNTSTSGQISNILSHPLGYINVLSDTAGMEFTNKLIGQSTLDNFSYIDVSRQISDPNYDSNIYNLILILFLFVVITDSYNIKVDANRKNNIILKLFSLILILGIILLIWTALYLSFTPVGELTINGVQNRYFIPLLIPLVLICFSNNKIKAKFNIVKYDSIIMLILTGILLYLIYTNLFIQFCM